MGLAGWDSGWCHLMAELQGQLSISGSCGMLFLRWFQSPPGSWDRDTGPLLNGRRVTGEGEAPPSGASILMSSGPSVCAPGWPGALEAAAFP